MKLLLILNQMSFHPENEENGLLKTDPKRLKCHLILEVKDATLVPIPITLNNLNMDHHLIFKIISSLRIIFRLIFRLRIIFIITMTEVSTCL